MKKILFSILITSIILTSCGGHESTRDVNDAGTTITQPDSVMSPLPPTDLPSDLE